MINQRSLLLAACLLAAFLSHGQVSPVYTQYMFDPYLINPSLLATSRKSEINLLYRQQWTGITDGPKTIQFDFQHAFNNRLGIGLNVLEDKTILLSNTAAMLTFGYRVPIAREHILGFGLSGGVVSNRIRLEDIPSVDMNDPIILSASSNSLAFDSQFGLHYSFRNLTLGMSLMNLIERKSFSIDELQQVQFSEIRNKIIFAGYKFNLTPDFGVQPNFLYRFTADNLNYYEASAVISYKRFLSVGGGYREGFGPTAIGRVYIKSFEIGFAYDLPSTKIAVSTGGSNEIQFKWRFGKELEKLTTKSKTPKAPEKIEEPVKEEPVPVKKEEVAEVKKEEVIVPVVAVVQEPKVEEAPPEEKPTAHLLIAGAFENQLNAQKLLTDLKKAGYEAEIIQLPGSNYYYVHLPKFKADAISLEKVLEIRKQHPAFLKDAWFIKSN